MNMQQILAQAKKMQKDITKKKEEINNSTFEGESEWVKVKINGKKEVEKITITFTGTIDDDDKEMLEDMIKIAINKANAAVDKETQDKLGSFGSDLGELF